MPEGTARRALIDDDRLATYQVCAWRTPVPADIWAADPTTAIRHTSEGSFVSEVSSDLHSHLVVQ